MAVTSFASYHLIEDSLAYSLFDYCKSKGRPSRHIDREDQTALFNTISWNTTLYKQHRTAQLLQVAQGVLWK